MRFDVETRGVNHPSGSLCALMVTLCALAFGISGCSAFSFGEETAASGGAAGSGGSTSPESGGGGTTTGSGGSAAGSGGLAGSGGAEADAAPSEAGADVGDGAVDLCPDDPMKTAPGTCGCGMPDDDSDGDGVADCRDGCPSDPSKTTAGACGCFIADTDSDGDGVADCNDSCPLDPTRSRPGVCGCGFADNTPLCLVHRYSFNDGAGGDAGADAGAGETGAGASSVVTDSVSGASGIATGVTLTGTGSVTFAGGSPQYITLPSGIISKMGNNATLEAWVTWNGAASGAWQRIFDFGTSDMGAGNQGVGLMFVFCTPRGGPAGTLFASYVGGSGLAETAGVAALPDSVMQHVALVIDAGLADGGGSTMSLYLQGALVTQTATTNRLSNIADVNNWLGKSQFAPDPYFVGVYHEFRIYSTARTAVQIAASFQAGPDALPAQ